MTVKFNIFAKKSLMQKLFSLICFSFIVLSNAQQVEMSDKSAYDFKVGSDYFKLSQSDKVFKNEESLKYIHKAKSNRTFALVFGSIGGAGIGFGAVRLLSAKKSEVYNYPGGGSTVVTVKRGSADVLLTGLVFAGAALPFAISVKKNIKKAVAAENGNVAERSTTSFQFGATPNGLAFNMQF